MFDESTDIFTTKSSTIFIRTFKNGKIRNFFYWLPECPDGRTQSLSNCLKSELLSDQIPLHNITGCASDDAANVSGSPNSLDSRLERKIPNFFGLKCICHNADLLASKARISTLISVADFFFNVSSYFSNSPRRITVLASIQQEFEITQTRIPEPSKIRWLTLNKTATAIIRNWLPLSVLFVQERPHENIPLELHRTIIKPPTKTYLILLKSCFHAVAFASDGASNMSEISGG